MGHRITQERREALRAEFLERAGAQFDALFDPDAQEGLQTFDQREQRAVELARAVGQWALQQHLGRDGSAGGEPAKTATCPTCGKRAELQAPGAPMPEARALETRVGRIEYSRPEYYCSTCRRSFFPGGPGVRARRGRV